MYQLDETKVKYLYNRFKRKAMSAYQCKHLNTSLRYLRCAAETGYSFYLGYRDDEMEDIIQNISSHIKRCVEVKRNPNECVFYDSFSNENGGLVQQYLGALIKSNYSIIYIAEREVVNDKDNAIGCMLREYDKSRIVIIPRKMSLIKKTEFIYECIHKSSASKLFIHSSPFAIEAFCAFYSLPHSIIKYKINLTDHTFWSGVHFIDYSFEFRQYGGNITVQKRGLTEDKILLLPFYPIMNHVGFRGYPTEVKGKVIIFSGGSYYKIFDSDDTYFKLVRSILDAIPKTIILYAGFGNTKVLDGKLERYNLKGRFIPIGQRADITEVFEHCDIYLNTYPFGGGLMSQYAAQLGKPIINYYTPDTTPVEEIVCQIKTINISDNSIEGVVKRVGRLVSDIDYRKKYGALIHSCVVSQEQFNFFFDQCMKSGKTPLPYNAQKNFVEHVNNLKGKIEIENLTKDYQIKIVANLGILQSIIHCPLFVINTIYSTIKQNRFFKALKNYYS